MSRRVNSFAVMRITCFSTILMVVALRIQAQEKPPLNLSEITETLRHQEKAWSDLFIKYECVYFGLNDQGEFQRSRQHKMEWRVTQSGKERIKMTTASADRATTDWIREESYPGEFYMSSDSQKSGSGTVGQQLLSLLPYESLKPFLYVSGVAINMPVSPAEYLQVNAKRIRAIREENGVIHISGDDSYNVGTRLDFWLDPKRDYQPVKIQPSDKNGILSIFEVSEFSHLRGTDEEFWFPSKAVWLGVDPTSRKFDSRVEYRVEQIDVNLHPDPASFVLTYPAGTLIYNRDTGTGFYLTEPTTAADAPAFKGKIMSVEQHDTEFNKAAFVKSGKARSWRVRWAVMLNVLVLLILLSLFVYHRRGRTTSSR